MNKSDSIKELAAALAKAQGQMQSAKKDVNNPFYKSKYADLASIVEAIKGPLSDNGLAYSQLTDVDDSGVCVETILMHTSGEWICGKLKMPVAKANDPQALGSSMTYCRRFALQAIVGLSAEDDDANKGADKTKPTIEQQVVAADIKPTAGVKEALPQDVMSRLVDKMTSIKDTFKVNPGKAYQEYTAYRDTLVGDADRGAAFASLLDAPMRTQFRKFREEAQTAQSA